MRGDARNRMESSGKPTKVMKRLASISFNVTGVAVSSSTTDPEPALPPMKKRKKKEQQEMQTLVAEDSCGSRGRDNSEASDCESDCQGESASSSAAEGGPEEDEALRGAGVLTVEEVAARRARMTRRLMKVYRAQYWGLMEELRTKYRRFYLRHGKSGWRDEDDGAEEGSAEVGRPQPESLCCRAAGCGAKPLALSAFCLAHILMEPRQRLYKPCLHKSASAAACGKPVLRAMVPPLCSEHFRAAQRQATRSLNRVLPGGAKYNPKLHLIVSQYVRVIQSKRRKKRQRTAAAAAARRLEANGNETSQGRPSAPAKSTV